MGGLGATTGLRQLLDESGPPFFALLPPPGRRTLEIGCGEGRVTRDLKTRGHAVVAVDAAPTLLRLAQEADPAGKYVLADAARLRSTTKRSTSSSPSTA